MLKEIFTSSHTYIIAAAVAVAVINAIIPFVPTADVTILQGILGILAVYKYQTTP